MGKYLALFVLLLVYAFQLEAWDGGHYMWWCVFLILGAKSAFIMFDEIKKEAL